MNKRKPPQRQIVLALSDSSVEPEAFIRLAQEFVKLIKISDLAIGGDSPIVWEIAYLKKSSAKFGLHPQVAGRETNIRSEAVAKRMIGNMNLYSKSKARPDEISDAEWDVIGGFMSAKRGPVEVFSRLGTNGSPDLEYFDDEDHDNDSSDKAQPYTAIGSVEGMYEANTLRGKLPEISLWDALGNRISCVLEEEIFSRINPLEVGRPRVVLHGEVTYNDRGIPIKISKIDEYKIIDDSNLTPLDEIFGMWRDNPADISLLRDAD